MLGENPSERVSQQRLSSNPAKVGGLSLSTRDVVMLAFLAGLTGVTGCGNRYGEPIKPVDAMIDDTHVLFIDAAGFGDEIEIDDSAASGPPDEEDPKDIVGGADDIEEKPDLLPRDLPEPKDEGPKPIDEGPEQDVPPVPNPDEGMLAINTINVGQGDTALVQGPPDENGKRFNVLIDIKWAKAVDEIADLIGPGQTLDMLICTHFDKDHIKGIKALFAEGLVDENTIFIEPSNNQGSSAPTVWGDWNEVAEMGVRVDACDMQHIDLGGGASIEIIAADGKICGTEDQIDDSSNNRSVVLTVKMGEYTHFSAGDIEKIIEDALAESGLVGEHDSMKADHHGAASSGSPNLMKLIKAIVVVITAGDSASCGPGFNHHGHPSQEILDTLSSLDIPISPIIYQSEEGGVDFDGAQTCNPIEEARDYKNLIHLNAYKLIRIKTDGKEKATICIGDDEEQCTEFDIAA